MRFDRKLTTSGTFPVKGGNVKGFLDAITVWINKPHVVNRRLSGTNIVQIKTAVSADSVRDAINSVLSGEDPAINSKKACNSVLEADLKENDEHFVIIIRQLLPKQMKTFPALLEAVVYDSASKSVTFHPVCYMKQLSDSESGVLDCDHNSILTSEVTYSFTFLSQDKENSAVELRCSVNPETEVVHKSHVQASVPWLKETLAPKIQSWTAQPDLSTAVKSLRLVGVDRYYQLYTKLKEKYGPELVKNWTETTDPQKFVYEDIGIATYLLLIWEEDRQRKGSDRKQSFVDLGCGNGLLVYILAKEGHQGLGIDLRKRNIWEKFGPDVHLEVKSITPSADNLFPDFDWIIGNHSDELTPWIPVIAARSSLTCSYFVLPCCLHDFNCRFNSKVKGESNYRSYLNYVTQVGQACGFEVEEDTLRIPSTKRVCHIGRHRTYPPDDERIADQKRQEFINERCALNKNTPASSNSDCKTKTSESSDSENLSATSLKRPHSAASDSNPNGSTEIGGDTAVDSKAWTETFQARSSTEQVRNCQKVSQETKDRVVHAVFSAVLAADDATEVDGQDGRRWKRGGSIHLSTVAGMLDSATREDLKSECGGVQTLLRNHSNIFQVSGGKVQLRDFSMEDPWSPFSKTKSRKTDPAFVKTSLCWFHDNHPDGCPRTAVNCTFAHGQSELRPKQIKTKKGW